ncbi:hypothetical protein NKH77_00505 [Streptomyces sp. M19]
MRNSSDQTVADPDPDPDPGEEAIARLLPRVHQYIAGILAGYGARHPYLRPALDRLITHGRRSPYEMELPLLVHAAVTGGPADPAVPVAAVQALWWRAANAFDDVADGDPDGHPAGMSSAVALMAALECGHGLPRALDELPLPADLRHGLVQDYLDGWSVVNDGQIGDLLNRPAEVTPEVVVGSTSARAGPVVPWPAPWPPDSPPPGTPPWPGTSTRYPPGAASVNSSACWRSSVTTRTTCEAAGARTCATGQPPTCWSTCSPRCPTTGVGGRCPAGGRAVQRSRSW